MKLGLTGLETQIWGWNPPGPGAQRVGMPSPVFWGAPAPRAGAAFRGRLHPLMQMFQLLIFTDHFSRQRPSL